MAFYVSVGDLSEERLHQLMCVILHTWKNPGGTGPTGMPSPGGRFPRTGLGAAAALWRGRTHTKRVCHKSMTRLQLDNLNTFLLISGATHLWFGAVKLYIWGTLFGPLHLMLPSDFTASITGKWYLVFFPLPILDSQAIFWIKTSTLMHFKGLHYQQ